MLPHLVKLVTLLVLDVVDEVPQVRPVIELSAYGPLAKLRSTELP